MIIRTLKYLLLFIILTVVSSYSIQDENEHNKILLQIIMNSLKQVHFEDVKINDIFSEKVFDEYIKSLDNGKRFFIKSDIDKLEKYKYNIDDEIQNSSFNFYNETNIIYLERFKSVSNYYKRILSNPFTFNSNETIETKPEKLKYAKDTIELYDKWIKILKFQALTNIVDALEIQEKAIEKKDTTIKIKTFDSLEVEARRKVMKTMDDYIDFMNKLTDNDRYEIFLNSITSIYDPHTQYFNPTNKEDFDIRMSGHLEGIGATLSSRDGYTKVAEIVPGSASWLQGELKAGDIILKVAQGSDEPVDIVNMRLDKAVKLIRGKKGTEVRLTVKKVDNSIVVIPIIRDIVVIKETYAKSAVITTKDDNEKIGYIYLPSFYNDFTNSPTSRQCAKDVKIEINKLKKQNVKGIIFDIRSNGGGSLADVVTMAGYFISKGPIVQVKSRIDETMILRDNDPKVEYDGPLAILINEGSASASEIFAAAMQDYKRAVIVGSSQSFGKGSVQQFFNIDESIPPMYDMYKPFGSIKITLKKFYRINGGSTQLRGVNSDIIIPDRYSYIDVGEKEQDNYMRWDEIARAEYIVWNGLMPDIKKIKEIEDKRIKENKNFQLIDEFAKRIKEQRNNTEYSLNIKTYREEQDKNEQFAKKFEDIEKIDDLINVTSLVDTTNDVKLNAENNITTDKWLKSMKKDIYINESLFIIKDIVKYNKKR